MGRSRSGSVIQNHSDHGASKGTDESLKSTLVNPLMHHDLGDLRSLIHIQITPKCTHPKCKTKYLYSQTSYKQTSSASVVVSTHLRVVQTVVFVRDRDHNEMATYKRCPPPVGVHYWRFDCKIHKMQFQTVAVVLSKVNTRLGSLGCFLRRSQHPQSASSLPPDS